MGCTYFKFIKRGEFVVKETVKIILEEVGSFIIGLYGLILIIFFVNVLEEGLERMVKFIANTVNAIRKTYSLHK